MENISIDKRAALEIIMDDEAIIIDVRTPEELEDVPPITDEVYNIPFNNEFINILEEEELDLESFYMQLTDKILKFIRLSKQLDIMKHP